MQCGTPKPLKEISAYTQHHTNLSTLNQSTLKGEAAPPTLTSFLQPGPQTSRAQNVQSSNATFFFFFLTPVQHPQNTGWIWEDLHTAGVTRSRGHNRELSSTNTFPVRIGRGTVGIATTPQIPQTQSILCCKPESTSQPLVPHSY